MPLRQPPGGPAPELRRITPPPELLGHQPEMHRYSLLVGISGDLTVVVAESCVQRFEVQRKKPA